MKSHTGGGDTIIPGLRTILGRLTAPRLFRRFNGADPGLRAGPHATAIGRSTFLICGAWSQFSRGIDAGVFHAQIRGGLLSIGTLKRGLTAIGFQGVGTSIGRTIALPTGCGRYALFRGITGRITTPALVVDTQGERSLRATTLPSFTTPRSRHWTVDTDTTLAHLRGTGIVVITQSIRLTIAPLNPFLGIDALVVDAEV